VTKVLKQEINDGITLEIFQLVSQIYAVMILLEHMTAFLGQLLNSSMVIVFE